MNAESITVILEDDDDDGRRAVSAEHRRIQLADDVAKLLESQRNVPKIALERGD